MSTVNLVEPIVGNWYRNTNENLDFEVIAYDPDDGLIEIQYLDGALEEFELEVWYRMELEYSTQQEDWAAPYEIEKDDLGFTDFASGPEKWFKVGSIEPDDDGY